MTRYLELVRAAREARNASAEQTSGNHRTEADRRNQGPTDVMATDERTGKLLDAGWKPKQRLGKTIWCRPDNGFWVSQEMAMHMLDEWNVRDKNGAQARG